MSPTNSEMYRVKLKIADIIIEMKSRFPIEPFDKEFSFRYEHFIYIGNKTPNICLEIHLVKTLPLLKKDTRRIFLTRHFVSNEINWALFKNENYYILREYLSEKNQHYILSQDFCKAKAYLLRRKKDKITWNLEEIIYDALQVILIHYISRRDGMFTHAVGIKDNNRDGLLLAGKSGRGKSTTARLWHKHSRAKVLNDDRIIVRKIKNRFFIYGSPWHGDFSDYLASRADRAKLKSIFFIYHSKENQAVFYKEGVFKFLYPCLFPAFWDKDGIEKIIQLCYDLLGNVPCFRLGFKNTREIIGFTRKIATTEARRIATTEARRIATTEARRIATTEARRIATTEARRIATTEARRIATTEARRIATTEARRIATTELRK
ncbi:MAG: hypothetical protein ISS47_05020, partial [Candidatus Omnitrophica bacterium]|nr:hypothetical protein [Candidatus Omnitrophota bacterium]